MATVTKGKVEHKDIRPNHFEVQYRCPCGYLSYFLAEERQTCSGCGTTYQLRIIIGQPATVKAPK